MPDYAGLLNVYFMAEKWGANQSMALAAHEWQLACTK
jgi:hypothetical protein